MASGQNRGVQTPVGQGARTSGYLVGLSTPAADTLNRTDAPTDDSPPQDAPWSRPDGYAKAYAEARFTTGTGTRTDRRERRILQRLVRLVDVGPGPWLDVPSGAGRLSGLLPGPVIRCDRDEAMLEACGSGPRVRASALALPFRDRSFRGALCFRLLHHLPETEQRLQVLRELRRVSDGPLIFSFFHSASIQHVRRVVRRRFGKKRSSRGGISWRRLLVELQEAGYRVKAAHGLAPLVSEQWIVLAEPIDPEETPSAIEAGEPAQQ